MNQMYRWVGMVVALWASGCGMEVAHQDELAEFESQEQELKNGSLIDSSGSIVELHTDAGMCTATLIDKNALVTAAHCGSQPNSYYPNIKVLAQQNSTTWRCLTGKNANGTFIQGSHSSALNSCPWVSAGFGSMLDYGPTQTVNFPGDDPGETWIVAAHDFAVVKVLAGGFVWAGTGADNYAAFYTGTITPNGVGWFYGVGKTNGGSLDYRVRRDQYSFAYNDVYVVGSFDTNAQTCEGDSGGPLGVFVSNPTKWAIVGTLIKPAERDPSLTVCGKVGGGVYWANATTRIWYVELALGKTCRSVNHNGVTTKECWDL